MSVILQKGDHVFHRGLKEFGTFHSYENSFKQTADVYFPKLNEFRAVTCSLLEKQEPK